MPIPAPFHGRLRVPAVAAPMFLVSNPDLVVETCRGGIVGTFPSLNQRTNEGYADWLDEIAGRLGPQDAPYGVNLIVNRSNKRLDGDLATTVARKVPLVITSLGAVKELVDAVHAYGGLVFHDVINLRHAAKAAEAGVDGLIAVSAGAGGHAGLLSPFAFLSELRQIFQGTLLLSGSITTGAHIAAARLMGADLAYIGTRFIATQESMASDTYKEMVLEAKAKDVIYTPAISGVNANFLRQSLVAAGLDPENLPPKPTVHVDAEHRPWKNIWSAGHGVGAIEDVPATAALCERLAREYREAVAAEADFARRQETVPA
ncbi:nitronate monooxygenase family protein [Roseomonas sp. NAR14]|uniref:Nitronate monooxygenase family protein n=1 Tax=Roseomonas acroporae TaxID=2937791 RepID=A0A9X1Y5T1_9PROT|nr:nitronate monooxygenase family protein [Roseomonas acroporae]MCK8784759.1 nitronate monooxygenase family protein [Roseomonas acroporae]